jgi:uncharacterized protein (TIGR02757 family)
MGYPATGQRAFYHAPARYTATMSGRSLSPSPLPRRADVDLKERLDALLAATDVDLRSEADPIRVPRRYADPGDAEIAGLIAALFAYGRVDLFLPVVDRALAVADRRGGPRAFTLGFSVDRDAPDLLPIRYRWTRGADLVLLFRVLQTVLGRFPGLEALLAEGWDHAHANVRPALTHAVDTLRSIALQTSGVPDFASLSLGFRNFLPSPADGSACKRWNLYLRWMLRKPGDGPDLGIWRRIPTRALVIPLDTHVLRIAGLLGLTARGDGSWRTAEEITARLATFDAEDPVRYDFALAHLGISGACTRGGVQRQDGARAPDCDACALLGACSGRAAGRPGRAAGRPGRAAGPRGT